MLEANLTSRVISQLDFLAALPLTFKINLLPRFIYTTNYEGMLGDRPIFFIYIKTSAINDKQWWVVCPELPDRIRFGVKYLDFQEAGEILSIAGGGVC